MAIPYRRRRPRPRPRPVRTPLIGAVRPRVQPPQPEPIEGGGEPQLVNPYDYNTDPILQRIRAFGLQSRQQAEAEAQRARAELDIQYGLGEAGAANPFSVRAKLAEARVREPKALRESLNVANLFYSGARGVRETDLQRSLLERETGAEAKYQEAQSGISQALREALLGASQRDIEAEERAAERRTEQLGELDVRPKPPIARVLRRPVARRVRRPPYRRPGIREM